MTPNHLLLLDIDGLRPDVFLQALHNDDIPHLAYLLGGRGLSRGLQIPALSTMPSATFCAQASLFTGMHPREHGIPGNQYLNRFRPRVFGFDVGEFGAVADALRVFTDGLAAKEIQVPTLYEKAAERGLTSVVAGHMYGRGANTWIRPSFWRLGLMTKGKAPLYVKAEENDGYVVHKLCQHIRQNGLPDITTLYFLGIDHNSHHHGPQAQYNYLVNHVDRLVGELWAVLTQYAPPDSFFVSIFSDHGQIEVPEAAEHTLSLREMLPLLSTAGRRVYRSPLMRLNQTDLFVGHNGGSSSLYVRGHGRAWAEAPHFEGDVLPLAERFWQANAGHFSAQFQDAITAVLVRDVAHHGWRASYEALTPTGDLWPLRDWFAQHPEHHFIDAANRLDNMAGPLAPDILLVSNYERGYYFGTPEAGTHGGLHTADSAATLFLGWPQSAQADWQATAQAITTAVAERCYRENQRQPSITDMFTALKTAVRILQPARIALS